MDHNSADDMVRMMYGALALPLIIVVVGALVLWWRWRRVPAATERSDWKPTHDYDSISEVFLGLRGLPASPGNQPEPTATILLIDNCRPQFVATLMVSSDGSTSIYYSAGGAHLGLGGNERIRSFAQKLLRGSLELSASMSSVEKLPATFRPGLFRITLVTSEGIRFAEDELWAVASGNHRFTVPLLIAEQIEAMAIALPLTPQKPEQSA